MPSEPPEESRWSSAMREALADAQSLDAPFGVNPRVGCVIVSPQGEIVGRGHHRGAGTPHAEVMALADAGQAARGATAVVTLEPCSHIGRTGPCTTALAEAGVAGVVYGQADPTEEAAGGAKVLRAAGVDVVGGVLGVECGKVNEAWTFAVLEHRPMVTWKVAASLDARVAGADGGPTAITGGPAREAVHELRAQVGAIVVGTGTALIDDPELTVRLTDGRRPRPLRVVVGSRPLPETARLHDNQAPTLLTDDHDPLSLLEDLYRRGVRHVLLEGGPTLAGAFLRARAIDAVHWYIAPLLLGAGPVALPVAVRDDGSPVGVDVEEVSVVGQDVRVVGRIRYE